MRNAQAEAFGNYSDDEEDENKILDNLFEETKEKPATSGPTPEDRPSSEAASGCNAEEE